MFDVIVLCGGGVKLAASLGSIQYMIDTGLMDSYHTAIGTSMGALVSIFIGAGVHTANVLHMMASIDPSKDTKELSFTRLVGHYGMSSIDWFHGRLRAFMTSFGIDPDITFKRYIELYGKSLIFSAFNLTSDTVAYFSHQTHPDMSCALAGCISSCVPLLFEPVEYAGHLYIDGGIFENFPIGYARHMFPTADILGFDIESSTKYSNLIEYISYLYMIVYKRAGVQYTTDSNMRIVTSRMSNQRILPVPIDNEKPAIVAYTDLYVMNYNLLQNQKLKRD